MIRAYTAVLCPYCLRCFAIVLHSFAYLFIDRDGTSVGANVFLFISFAVFALWFVILFVDNLVDVVCCITFIFNVGCLTQSIT